MINSISCATSRRGQTPGECTIWRTGGTGSTAKEATG